MNDVEALLELCSEFLAMYFSGQPGHEDRQEFGLRLVCLGTERAVQGELLHYLRTCGVNAVLECGVTGEGSIDIVAFNEEWAPISAIELKHRSANQGPIARHVNELEADRIAHAVGALNQFPLIQMGLFTAIQNIINWNIDNWAPPKFGLYRFLAAHYHGVPNQSLEDQVLPDHLANAWTIPAVVSQFGIGGLVVQGCVGTILRIVQPNN